MFDISDGKLKVVNCRDYFTTAELESLLAEKFNSGDYSRGDFDISLNEHSIKCEQTVFGEGNNGGYFEKALIRCDVKYEADGKFAFENPVITMLEEK